MFHFYDAYHLLGTHMLWWLFWVHSWLSDSECSCPFAAQGEPGQQTQR